MYFITLAKFRKMPTQETIKELGRLIGRADKEGIKFTRGSCYYTLGRYDIVAITKGSPADERKTIQAFMKAALRFGDLVSTETLVAVPAEDIEDEIE